jgi:hypothetical protein
LLLAVGTGTGESGIPAKMATIVTSPVEYLRELAAALERRELPPPAVCERIVRAIRRVENQEADEELTLDAALAVSPSQWKRERLIRRNAIICQAHERYLANLSLRAAGKRIAQLGRELRSDRSRSVSDGLSELVRDALALRAPFPSSARQIENILTGRAK